MKKTDAQKRSEAARLLQKASGSKPGISQWKNKTPEQRKAHIAKMNAKSSTWRKHLENVAALGETIS